MKPTTVSPQFNILGQARTHAKQEENDAIEARRAIDGQICELPEFATHKRKQTITVNSGVLEIAVRFDTNDKYNMTEIVKQLPADIVKRLFPPKYEFSQSNYNAVKKEMESTLDVEDGKLLKKIDKALAAHVEEKDAAPYVAVKAVDSL